MQSQGSLSGLEITVHLETIADTGATTDIHPISGPQWQTWFQTWLVDLQFQPPQLSQLECAYELSLRLTGDADIQALNAQYRQQDKPTDVLAFAALEDNLSTELYQALAQAGEPIYLGDIVISVETAQRQAQTQQHDLDVELAWLAAHGLLHLLGWDHPDPESLAQMLGQQEHLLGLVNLKSPAKL